MYNRSNDYKDRLLNLRSSAHWVGEKNKVTIIGAGISGLVCAHELQKKGYDVTILEADGFHVGGRIRTIREGSKKAETSVYIEVGAMRIPKGHSLTRLYCKELNLSLRKFVQSNDKTWAFIRNKRFRRNSSGLEQAKSLFDLTKKEQSLSADDMWEMSVTKLVSSFTDEEIMDLYSNSPKTQKIKELDKLSLHHALQKSGLSQEAIEYVTSVYGVNTYLHSALTEHLREEVERVWIDGFDEIVGGNDLLPSGLFNRIKNKVNIIQGAEVTAVRKSKQGLTTHYVTSDKTQHIKQSHWVISTVPLGVMTKIDLVDVISPEKARAIRQISYDSSTKIIVKTKNRFWELEDGIYGGGSIWDGGLGHTWYPSDNWQKKDAEVSQSPSYLLASYTWGQQARRLDALHHQDVKKYVIHELKKIHPQLQDEDILSVIRWNWTNYSLTSGAFAFFNPSEQSNHYGDMKTVDNNFIVAGEHASHAHSWIQGAIESSVDAVQHIIDKNV